jgi:cell division septal protein FtsQ
VQEREPVAYVHLQAERAARVALIDADGTILQQPPRAHFVLPVIRGIRAEEVQPARRDKVHLFVVLMKDIGPLSERVSEVDVSDRANIKLTARANNRAMLLWMGDQNFSGRLQNFVNHYPDIQRRLPGATTLDLRLDDRITVVEEAR